MVKESLSVCSTWRQAALESLWKTLQLSINEENNDIFIVNPEWAKQFLLPENAESLIRQLKIHVSISSIISGTAYKLLASYMGNAVSLPLVNKILIMINNNPIEREYVEDVAFSNAIEFAKKLNSLTTKETTETELKYNGTSESMSELEEMSLGVLLNKLYSKTRHPILYLNTLKLGFAPTIDQIPQLSTICTRLGGELDLHASLVHRCANTLQYLDVDMHNAMALLYDAHENAVVYPNMRQLMVANSMSNVTVNRVPTTSIAPFPNLFMLVVPLEYPFYNDVLFQGNNNTLKYLELCMDTETANMLNRRRVFDGKHKRLRTVSIRESNRAGGRANVPINELSNVLTNMAR
ncbi:hypothetical protein GGH92_005894, partial [Coemansia sp. RSA 2673]